MTKRNGGQGGADSNRNKQNSSNDFTTFFFANFPNGYGELDMVRIFKRWARVKEVFISRRVNKWGRRFGFVRFFEVRNVGRLEKDLDQIYIGNKKLHVNILKYRRSELEAKGLVSENRGLGSVNRVYQGGNSRKPQEGTVMAREQKRTKEVWKVKTENKSYADAVKDNSQRMWKGLAIFSKKQVLPWMKNSLVGHFREELNFEELGEEFVKGGMSMVRVRYMGDNVALLTL